MSVNQRSRFGPDEGISSVVASVVGATLAGVLIQTVGGVEAMAQFGQLIGQDTVAAGWRVWLGQGVVLGVVFALGMARAVNPFTDAIIHLSRRSTVLQALLVPLLHRSALAVTAGSLGLLYGQFLLVPLFAYLAPVALGFQGYTVAVPLATVPVVLGYIVFGSVLGGTYGLVLETRWLDVPPIAEEHVAALTGAVAGGIAGTGVLAAVGGTELLAALGATTGTASVARGALLSVAVAVGFGLPFAFVLARTINEFTNTVIMFSRRSKRTQKILVPLITRAALTVTAGSMGLVYGLVLGLAAVGLGTAGVIPQVGLAGLVACTVYGNVLGYGYGLVMEDVDLSGLGPSAEQRAGLVGSVGAGLLSAGVLAVVLGPSVFVEFAGLLGSIDRIASLAGPVELVAGLALWMAVAVLFGLVFVAYVSRTINEFTNTVIMFSRRSKLTQKVLVPLITRAALTVTAGSMGLVYGLVLGVAAYGGVLAGVLPQMSPLVIVAFAIYGQALGTSYGLLLEDVDLSLPAVFGRDDESGEESIRLIEVDWGWFTRWSLRGSDESSGESVRLVEVDWDWFARRPTRGAGLLVVGGVIMAVISLLARSGATGPSPAALGIVFGSMLAASGVFAFAKPQLSTIVGVTGVGLSIVSIVAAFGGLFVGMVLGFVGGTLCLAWEPPAAYASASDGEFTRVGNGDRQLSD